MYLVLPFTVLQCIDNQEKYLTTQLIDKENHESRVKERRANLEAITKASASTPKRVIPTATVASSATNVFNTVSSTVNVASTVNDFVSVSDLSLLPCSPFNQL